MVVDCAAENEKWTDLLLKRYNIRKSTETAYPAAANRVIKRGYRLISDALSKLPVCSNEPKGMWIDHLPAAAGADRIVVRHTTGYWPFCRIFTQDVVLPILVENLTWTTANWIQGINDTASHIAARARLLEPQREDIHDAVQNLNESRDAN